MSRPRSVPALLIVLGGLGIAVGAALPWMYYFAGLIPLRGVIGLNGRLLLGAGALCIAFGVMVGRGAWRGPVRLLRGATAAVGTGVMGVAIWLLMGVWELAAQGGSGMLAMRPGPGLFVIGAGGLLLAASACLPAGQGSS